MKKLLTIQCFFLLLSSASFSQLIQGDRLLSILGKPFNAPLVLQFRQQEDFFNDNWNRGFTVHMDRAFGNFEIGEVTLLNGQKKVQSEERYGYYRRELPLNLSWEMTWPVIQIRLGSPVKTWYETTHDYLHKGFKIRIQYEGNKPVMMRFEKDPGYIPLSSTTILRSNANGAAELNWPVLKKFVRAGKNMKQFTGKDTIRYGTGMCFYSTPYKVEGFDRCAVERPAAENYWFYQAYLRTSADSNKVGMQFFSMYEEMRKTIRDSSGNEFVLTGNANDRIGKDPMHWIAKWETNNVQPGQDKMRITLGMSGTKNANNKMEYTIKFYIAGPEIEFDFYIWPYPD